MSAEATVSNQINLGKITITILTNTFSLTPTNDHDRMVGRQNHKSYPRKETTDFPKCSRNRKVLEDFVVSEKNT